MASRPGTQPTNQGSRTAHVACEQHTLLVDNTLLIGNSIVAGVFWSVSRGVYGAYLLFLPGSLPERRFHRFNLLLYLLLDST